MCKTGGFNQLLHGTQVHLSACWMIDGLSCQWLAFPGLVTQAAAGPWPWRMTGCRSLCCARAVVHDLHVEGWHVLAAEILSYAKSSRSSGSDDHPCMSSKAEKFCSSEKCGESFFCSSVRYVIGCLWARIFFLVTECSAGVGSSFQRRLLKSARSCAVVVE